MYGDHKWSGVIRGRLYEVWEVYGDPRGSYFVSVGNVLTNGSVISSVPAKVSLKSQDE